MIRVVLLCSQISYVDDTSSIMSGVGGMHIYADECIHPHINHTQQYI